MIKSLVTSFVVQGCALGLAMVSVQLLVSHEAAQLSEGDSGAAEWLWFYLVPVTLLVIVALVAVAVAASQHSSGAARGSAWFLVPVGGLAVLTYGALAWGTLSLVEGADAYLTSGVGFVGATVLAAASVLMAFRVARGGVRQAAHVVL